MPSSESDRGAWRLAFALSTALTVAACSLGPSPQPQRHADGAGPLGAIGRPGSQGDAVDPRSGGPEWTWGVPLCVLDSSSPPTIQSVTPTKSVGRYRLLGIRVRSWTPTASDTPIIAVAGYPPTLPDELHDPIGFAITTACGDDPLAPHTELLVGLGIDGTDGGGWEGVDVTYSVGGLTRILQADWGLLICGPVVQDRCMGTPFPRPT